MKKITSKPVFVFIVNSSDFFILQKRTCTKSFLTEPVPIILLPIRYLSLLRKIHLLLIFLKKLLIIPAESENIIISPLSISSALSMTLNGANGATRDSMLDALRMNGLTPDIINNSYKDLTEALLNVDKRVMISIANSVWTENNFVVKKPFTDILAQYYNAESKSFDITDPLVPKQVNNWIEVKQTD